MASDSHTSRKYNIVYFIDGLGMGGAERMMVPVLQNLDRKIFEPRVCVFQVRNGNPVADDLRSLGVPVDLLPVPYLRDLSALPRLRQYLKQVTADLVHTQLEFADTLGNPIAKSLRLPSVSTLHTMPSQEIGVKSKAHQKVEWFSLRHFCDRVISVSEGARLYHLALGGASEKQMVTIYNGIDLTHFSHLEDARLSLRAELGIPFDALVLTTVAVLREPKGIQFMIRALPEIVKANPKAIYLIAGDGPHRAALTEEVARVGAADHVIFAGMRKDVPRVLAASDIFVLPTLTEALPTVLAEAMAVRLPIVACAVGGVPEMVTDGENGLLLPPGNPEALAAACVALLGDAGRRKAMGERGWQVVQEKFNILGQVHRLKELYLDLIRKYGK
jgi:glycosyltransferase involved in cell wall biosynthesis